MTVSRPAPAVFVTRARTRFGEQMITRALPAAIGCGEGRLPRWRNVRLGTLGEWLDAKPLATKAKEAKPDNLTI